jgi:hypothetical protein
MAFTKTPESDTHSFFRIPPRGNQSLTAVTAPYTNRAGLRYVNCYPTIRESKTQEPVVTLTKAPRLESVIWIFPDNDPGVTAYDYQTNLFVYKNRIYFKELGQSVSLKHTATGYKFLSCQKIVDYAGNGDVIITGLVIKDSNQFVYSYTYNKTTDTFEVGDNALAGPGAPIDTYALVRDLMIDGYHIVATKSQNGGTNRIYVSNAGQPNVFYTSTDYFVPEIDPDDVVDIQKHRNFICVIGTHSVEFFYNSGNELGSPFQRQDNYTLRLGAAQNLTFNFGLVSAALGDDIYFVASSENGGNAIYVIRNFQAIKISDDYIDRLLSDQGGVVKDISPSAIELGFADVMGNNMLVVQFRNQTTGYLDHVFVFNERDMVWWEWVNSNEAGFVASDVGIGNLLSGKPFFLDGPRLNVASNAQFSVIIPGGTTFYYEYDFVRVLNIDAHLKYSKTVSIDAHLTV